MILKRPSFRRGGKPTGIDTIGGGTISGNTVGSNRTGFQNPSSSFNINLGGGQPKSVSIGTKTLPFRQNIPTGGLTKGTRGAQLLTQLRNLAIPGATTVAGTLGIPVATVGGLAYLNRPRTLKEKEYMQNIGALDETFGTEEDYKAYFDERDRLSKEGDEISFTDALFMDPETGTYPKAFGRTEDREIRRKIEEAKQNEASGGDINMTGDPVQFTGEDEETNFEEIQEFLNPNKKEKVIEESSITLDPKEEIRKESEFIKDLLKNENLTRGENALILAKAVGTPGSISDKISKAADLALPIIKGRDKQDKAITLKAYELYKQKEAAQAKRDAPTPSQKEIAAAADALIKQGDKRSKADIIADITVKAAGLNKEGMSLLSKGGADVINLVQSIRKERVKLEEATADGNEKKIEKIQKKIKKLQGKLGDFAAIPGFDDLFVGYRKLYLAEGGRIGYALGTPQEEEVKVSETIVDTPGAPTPERQVLKLSYSELRNKLPKEISDDIVELLANSTEALQDFAYITTQDDVSNFNVKYGVNLVIPPATA